VLEGAQFVIATHSPIVPAYAGAAILNCSSTRIEIVAYEDAEPVRLTQSFLEGRERFLEQLLAD
jgi:predicted ATPase